ncbi:tripartite motif-containing protein 16-like [Melanotaenia boesemani]|uniref:tripartite motif-containing protein 16-like n=1 Tax=Melanotaenia boesemani TaxID=1250792 RepID=UPI001C041E38|nr:tripartite motif-containing protein 16-like [Melanotaenia boesemani]
MSEKAQLKVEEARMEAAVATLKQEEEVVAALAEAEILESAAAELESKADSKKLDIAEVPHDSGEKRINDDVEMDLQPPLACIMEISQLPNTQYNAPATSFLNYDGTSTSYPFSLDATGHTIVSSYPYKSGLKMSWTCVEEYYGSPEVIKEKLEDFPGSQRRKKMDSERISCSICLDLLKDPVTTSCGHSYCMNCIETHWNEEDQKGIHSCPQCRRMFIPRPVLEKNILLAELVEELKKTGLRAAPADHCYAGPEDVACDVCTGRKLKAIKSCLVCRASYCEKHLQPHYEAPPLQKHKLVEPSKNLQQLICSRHDEVMKIFCRTDQQSICYLCLMDEHKGHETVPAAAERAEKQKELEVSRQQIQQRIQDGEKDVKLLQQEVEAINGSADKAVEDSEKIFTELIRLIQKRSSDVKQQIRSQQEAEVSRVKELQEKLEQEITELKRKDGELEQLSHTEDHNQFLHNYPSLSALSESTHSSSINIRPLRYFEDVTAAVSETRDKLQDILTEKWTNVSLAVTDVDVLLSEPEPKSRDGFLQYSTEITLDPNTANTHLLLSEGNRNVTVMKQHQFYSSHSERFTHWHQVLSRESLTGRCYWEVEWRGEGVYVAVAYKNISRAGDSYECVLGLSNKSWSLRCERNSYTFWHNKVKTPLSGPPSSRIGVYLDHRAGILSFYSVSETMTLLHRVQTTFTQPLYAGLWLGLESTAEFIK